MTYPNKKNRQHWFITNRQNIVEELKMNLDEKTSEVFEDNGKIISYTDVIANEIKFVEKAIEENTPDVKKWEFDFAKMRG